MLASEVTLVLKALRGNGIDIVAIHHHMIETQPDVSSMIGAKGTGRSWRLP